MAELGIPCDGPLIYKPVEVYRTHTPTLTLPPESQAVLEDLKDSYTLGLLTDGYLPTQRLKVQALVPGRRSTSRTTRRRILSPPTGWAC